MPGPSCFSGLGTFLANPRPLRCIEGNAQMTHRCIDSCLVRYQTPARSKKAGRVAHCLKSGRDNRFSWMEFSVQLLERSGSVARTISKRISECEKETRGR